MNKINKLLSLGTPLESKNYAYEIKNEKEKSMYIIEKGHVDAFVVLISKKQHFQKRIFMISRSKNEMFSIFEEDEEEYDFLYLASPGSIIKRVSQNELEEAVKKDEELKNEFIRWLNRWINRIYNIFVFLPNDDISNFIPLEKDYKITIEDNKTIKCSGLFSKDEKEDAHWIRLSKGQLYFLGNPKSFVEINKNYFPISPKAFFLAKEEVDVSTITTKELVEENLWMDSIIFFEEKISKYNVAKLYHDEERETLRIEKKKHLHQEILETTLSNLGNVLTKKLFYKTADTDNNLFNALLVLGKNSDLVFKLPQRLHSDEKVIKAIGQIAEESAIRFRKVTLDKHWYNVDNGDLLGFLKEGNKPVAFIKKEKGYFAFIPELNQTIKVTKKTADLFSDLAFVFFNSLPERKISNKEVVKFCLLKSKSDILSLIGTGVGSIFLALYIPFANSMIFGRIIPLLDNNLLYQVGAGLFVFAICSSIFSFVTNFTSLRIQSWVNARLQTAIWDKLLNLPISFFRKYTIGDLVRRVYSITEIRYFLSTSFFKSILKAIFSFVYLLMMFYYSPALSYIGLSIVLTGTLFNFLLIKRIIAIDSVMLNVQGKFNSFVLQAITGIEKIRVTGSEKVVYAKWGEIYRKMKTLNYSSNTLSNILNTVNAVLPKLGILGTYGVALTLFLKQGSTFSLGNFIAFNAAFGSFSAALYGAFTTVVTYFGMIIPRWRRARVILDTQSEEKENKLDPGRLQGFVKVENVFFKYEENSPVVLKGVDLEASPGEFIALVGASGCGKSTIINALLNFISPTSGSVYFDGKSLSDLDATKVRRQMGVVMQDSNLLSGSVQENLLCGGMYTQEQIERALKLSGFDEVLKEMPMGLHTYLVENGKNLSGGQKQLLLIARALLGDPKILIFDEATNALDNETQSKVSKNIDNLKLTRIVIAHRLSTIANADRIYVLQDGKIADTGTFDELKNKEGLFQSFVQKQKL
jgi:NHLM bacteriocin system ABC transporter ATP-binding protein